MCITSIKQKTTFCMAVRIMKTFQFLQFHTMRMDGPRRFLGEKHKVKSLVLQLASLERSKN